jgi:PAS domain S-box-containing protein
MKPHPNPMAAPSPGGSLDSRFQKVILRLVKSAPERLAIEAGQVDAIVDPSSGAAILLPEAQRVLRERNADHRGLIGLAFDWWWEQDADFRFVSHASATDGRSGFAGTDILGKALWELGIDNLSEVGWRTHRQQLAWHATFRDLELRYADRRGAAHFLALSGEAIFDRQDQFKGYRGIARDITARRQAEGMELERIRFADAGFQALSTPACLLDGAGQVLAANAAWRQCAAAAADAIGTGACAGTNYLLACDAAGDPADVDGDAIVAGLRQVLDGERARFSYHCGRPAVLGRSERRWVSVCVARIEGDTQARAVVWHEDNTERMRETRLLGLELEVASGLAAAIDAPAGLRAVMQALCDAHGWDCGRYFRRDPASGLLRCTQSWGLPVPAVEQFLEKSRDMVLRPDAGLVGRVLQSGQPLWVVEGSMETSLSKSALAPETGAEGSFLFPIRNGDEVVGVLAFSGRAVREPDDRELQTVRSIGSQLGQFLRQQAAISALRQSAARYRDLTELATDWTWEQDREFRFTRIVGASPFAGHEDLGLSFWELPKVILADALREEHRSRLEAQWSFCDFEFAVEEPGGRQRLYCISGQPLYDEAGAFAGYCGTGLDITERKRAQIATWESEPCRLETAGPPSG